jgi:FkbM family methyltransferase
MWNTIRFHISNRFTIEPLLSKEICVNIKNDFIPATKLWLRPFAGDLFVFYEVLSDRCYDLPDTVLAPEAVRCIVDCGANIGLTSLFLAARYPNATIYSIEPHPANFVMLKRNVQQEPRIIPIHAAIVGIPRPFVRLSANKPAWGNQIEMNGTGAEVPAFTVSQICEMLKVTQLDLIKIDIEGAEQEVFEHAEFVPRVGLGLIELHGDYTFEEFASDVASWGGVASRERDIAMITFRRIGNSCPPGATKLNSGTGA